MTITIENAGRRYYLRGNTYGAKETLRAAGCHWDATERAWWTGRREQAEQMAARLGAAPSASTEQRDDTPRDGAGSAVAGRAEYKGKTYYVAGREDRDDGSVRAVTTRDGSRVLLYFRDGSRQFWAARDDVRIVKEYRTAQTIRSLREFAEQAKQARAEGRTPGQHSDDCRCYRCRMEMADALEDQDYFSEAAAVRRGEDW